MGASTRSHEDTLNKHLPSMNLHQKKFVRKEGEHREPREEGRSAKVREKDVAETKNDHAGK